VTSGGLYQRLYDEQRRESRLGRRRLTLDLARLQALPLFSGLGPGALATLAQQLTRERYAAGEDIVRQGDAGETLYIIERGRVEVVVGGGSSEQRVNVLADGDYFGEMALLTGEARTATVRAVIPTEVYSLARADFLTLLDQEPGIQEVLAETVARRRVALQSVAASAAASGPG
jgi:CRP-like cAMP-binding protein